MNVPWGMRAKMARQTAATPRNLRLLGEEPTRPHQFRNCAAVAPNAGSDPRGRPVAGAGSAPWQAEPTREENKAPAWVSLPSAAVPPRARVREVGCLDDESSR